MRFIRGGRSGNGGRQAFCALFGFLLLLIPSGCTAPEQKKAETPIPAAVPQSQMLLEAQPQPVSYPVEESMQLTALIP